MSRLLNEVVWRCLGLAVHRTLVSSSLHVHAAEVYFKFPKFSKTLIL